MLEEVEKGGGLHAIKLDLRLSCGERCERGEAQTMARPCDIPSHKHGALGSLGACCDAGRQQAREAGARAKGSPPVWLCA